MIPTNNSKGKIHVHTETYGEKNNFYVRKQYSEGGQISSETKWKQQPNENNKKLKHDYLKDHVQA